MNDADSAPATGQAGDDFDAAFDKAWAAEMPEEADPTESKPPAEAPAPEEAASDDAKPTTDSAEAPPEADKPAGTEGDKPEVAPSDWSDAERQAYGRLPKQAQTQVMRLYKSFQAGYTRKSQELSDKAKQADALSRAAEPYRRDLETAGIDAVGAFQRLSQIHAFAKAQPVEYAKWFMQQAGIKPEQLGFATQSTGTEPEGYQDPSLAKLEERLSAFERTQQDQQRAAEARVHQSIQAEIMAFRDAKNEAGEPKHPHYERLKGRIASILRGDPKATLAGAYEEALWGDTELRSQRIEAERTAALAEERRKAQEAADKAKLAGRNPQGSPGAKATKRAKDFDDSFAEAERKLGVTWS